MSTENSHSPSFFAVLKKAVQGWSDAHALRLSAALSYYSIFSIAPLLVLSVGIAGLFFGEKAIRGEIESDLTGLVGLQAAKVIQSMVQSTSQPSKSLAATVIGLATLLIGASGVFGQLKDALNIIWNVKPKAGNWKLYARERLLSFGMVLVIGFLLLVSLSLTTLLNTFSDWITAILRLPDWIWGGAGVVVSLAVITLLFALIFKVLPDANIRWRHVWVGAAFTAVLFEAGKFGLAFYLGRESTASSFGAAGSVVLILLWVYYASCLVLFGAGFTKEYACTHGACPEPSAISELASATPAESALLAPQPAHESLTAVFPPPPSPPAPEPQGVEKVTTYMKEHMAVSVLGGLGCGLAVGMASRIAPQEAAKTPEAKIRTASQMFGAALLMLATRYRVEIAHRLPLFLKHTRTIVRRTVKPSAQATKLSGA